MCDGKNNIQKISEAHRSMARNSWKAEMNLKIGLGCVDTG